MTKQIFNIRKMKPAIVLGRIDASSFNKESNEVNVVFATETLVQEKMAGDNGERFYEQLAIEKDAADLTRFNSGAAVLDNHSAESVKNQFGKVLKAWIDEGTKEAWATVRLSKQEEWKTVVGDIADGIITNISFKFSRKQMVDTGKEQNGLRILKTTKWEGLELSFVTIPADPNAGVRSFEGEENEVTLIDHNKNSKNMTEQEKKARKEAIEGTCRKLKLSDEFTTSLVENETVTIESARELAIEESAKTPAPAPVNIAELQGVERKRALDIAATCRKLNLHEVKNTEGVLFSDELIGKNISLDQARTLAIDKAAELQADEIKINGANSATVKNAERDSKRAQAKEHAILQRAGVDLFDEKGDKIKLDPDVYRGMSLKEIALEGLVERGFTPRNMKEEEIKMWVLDKTMGIRSAGQLSTSDFPAITENVLNKVALQRYMLAERTWEPLVKKRTVRDFKPISNVRLNDVVIDETSIILEGGEYTMATMNDSKETYKIQKYGKKAVLSWEALVNDDLSLFNDTASIIVDGFTQLQNKFFYQILASTAALKNGSNKMADGNLLFHATHNNLLGVNAIGITGLTAARLALRTQTAPNGSKLNLTPRFLVVGPQNETLAEQFTSASYVATEQGKINKLGQSLTPIVDANITDASWFLFAQPSSIPTIEVAHLDGQEMFTESRYSFDVDGMEIKFRMTHGIKAIDFRGIVKTAGA